MVTKLQVLELAVQNNWTKADAERAIEDLKLENYSDHEIMIELIRFAGKELRVRQRKQAFQKGEVTKLKKEISAKEKIILEIKRLVKMYDYEEDVLINFANFILNNQDNMNAINQKVTELLLANEYHKEVLDYFVKFLIEGPDRKFNCKELKQEIFSHFGAKNSEEIRKNSSFMMATNGIKNINFSQIVSLEKIYRQTIGILPNERYEIGYGCINGNNIFKYDFPWRIFCLNPKTVTKDKLKKSYHDLAKIYHPDNLNLV